MSSAVRRLGEELCLSRWCDPTQLTYATGRRTRIGWIRTSSEKCGLSGLDIQLSISCALCTGRVPPSTQDKLNNERLPQTQQVS